MSFFTRLFGRKRRIEHSTFGPLLYFDFGPQSYWEGEAQIDGRLMAIMIEAGEEGPTEAQALFYRNAMNDLDALFERVRSVIVPKYESWMNQPFPSEWRKAFAFVGMTVPRNGDELNDWDISFDCLTDPKGHMFTVDIEDGKPTSVAIDG